MKFAKSTYILLLIAVAVVAGTLNFTFAAPLADLIANPASTIAFKGTQYAITLTTPTAGTIKTIEVQFPAGMTITVGEYMDIVAVNPSTGARMDGTNLGVTTFTDDSGSAPTLIYTFDTALTTLADTDWLLFIAKVRNPASTGDINTSLSVTTKDSGGTIIDGPTSGNFGLQELYNADSILNAINSKSGDICIGSGC